MYPTLSFTTTLRFVLVAAVVVGADVPLLDLDRCADAKANNPALMTVVSIVLSLATEFDRRSELRRTEFQNAISLDARTGFRPAGTLMGSTSTHLQDDNRSVCVQPLFVLSPWQQDTSDEWEWAKIARGGDWLRIAEESKLHRDLLIAPTIIDTHNRARVLMYILEWSRQRVPWADYVLSADTSAQIHWAELIKLFPPPVAHHHASRSLWLLGRSGSSAADAIFFVDPRNKTLHECADIGLAAFSRELVRQMTSMPFASQILYAVRHPFQMYCNLGAFS